ncbi:Troponin [Dictyocaulus viviparus]|uniref:Troponin n=1 Tax=Dictyocaulus viviparus TaxID=29172 RepID=A0A0D8XTV2_DICVI|nr:Troponin [Dictyocaulus viviparus]
MLTRCAPVLSSILAPLQKQLCKPVVGIKAKQSICNWSLSLKLDKATDRVKRLAERERKKEAVRKRLEEASRAKKAKKGFLTPERKKKLRKLLMMKAAEDLKQQQMLKEQERQRVLQERIIPLPDLDECDDLEEVYNQMRDRLIILESENYDVSYIVRQKDFEINELTIAVNDLRGKFVKPTLKKVSKTEGKFDKLKKKEASKVDFRSTLKTIEKNQFAMEEDGKEKAKADWAK